jgi:conjugal transfer pilus assembly protein TraD
MSDSKQSTDDILSAAAGISLVCGAVIFGPGILSGYLIWKGAPAVRLYGPRKLVRIGALMLGLGIVAWFLWFDPFPLYRPDFLMGKAFLNVSKVMIGRALLVFWWGGMALVLCLAPLILSFKKPSKAIVTDDFEVNVKRFDPVLKLFEDETNVPIGIDVRTGKVITLSEEKRCSHLLALGATGSGKSTLLLNLALHAVRHGMPCIIIDPKGEDSTLEFFSRAGRALAQDFDQKFRVFRMSSPETSAFYNPLKHGNSIQLKDRLMEALNWSEQYYQSVAADFLTVFTACMEKIGVVLTLERVTKALGDDEALLKMLKPLEKESDAGDLKSRELLKRMAALKSKVKSADLHGLAAQLSILNNPYIGHLMSFDQAENEIDLRQALERNEIIYFQLDTLGNPDTARRLGRIIIEDIKGLASWVYKNVSDEKRRKFLPIFIDEFGSFASKEFIEVLKQIRGAKFGAHLFAQGLEDLDVVSREFRRQASSNPITKIAMRLDDSETVDEICSMAGTLNSLEQSYQVEGKFMPRRTGAGNMRETKQMRVEHDVIKNLETGQAVVIEKSPGCVRAIQVFHPSILIPGA